jgi:hypothetical protein
MASTYSTLKIELIATGEQSGTWGTTTNTNLGTAIEEAIVGSADVSFSSADVTLTLTDTNAAQSARNLRLNLTGTSGGARNLILGSGCQIEKPYLINNGLSDTVTVKNTTGTGIAVPAGKTMWVYNNGTNVVDAVTHLTSLTLGSALPIASGGTGSTSTTFVNLTTNVTGTLPIANGGTGSTSTTFVNLATNVTGILPVTNGGTGITSFGTGVATALGQNVTGSGGIALATSPSFTTPTLGVATATSVNKVAITAPATSATLTIANGKTLTANNSLTLAGTDATTMTFPGTSQTVVGTTETQTLTDKRINPRVVAASGTSGNLTINGDTTDLYKAEGLTGAITFLQPSGTPVDGQKLLIRLKDDGTARGITWTTSAGAFRAIGITLPTTTVLGKVTYVGCVYNSTDSFWDAVATVTQA